MLLGRERERHAVDGVLAAAREGRSAVLALVGEPGIGKSALLEYAAGCAGGLTLLRARSVESETHVPFAGLFELLRPLLPLIGRIPRPQAAALESALALRPAIAGERFAVAAATLSLLSASADEAPVLVLVDDAHLLDAATAEALRFALRRLLAEPLGVVLAVRDHEPSLLDGSDIPTLRVEGLDPASAAALLGGVPPDVADRLYRATAGNPLALTELARDAPRLALAALEAPIPVPSRVSDVFLRRARGLDGAAQRLLVLAAAGDIGDVATLEHAARMQGLGLDGLDAIVATGLVRADGGRLEFTHPLARAAIYNHASPEQRRDAHRSVAAALPDRDADRRAWHLAAATLGTDDVASSALEQAGLRARARSAYAVAAAAFERSAQLARSDERRCQVLVACAEAAWLAGLADVALEAITAARSIGDDSAWLGDLEALRGHIAIRRGAVTEGRDILITTAQRMRATDPEVAISLLAEAVEASFYAGAAGEMTRAAQGLRDLLPLDASPRSRFLVAMGSGMAAVFAGDAKHGIESIRIACGIAMDDDALRRDSALLPWLVMGPMWLRDAGPAQALVAEAIETARAQAAIGVLPVLLNRVARDHAAADEWTRAEVEYDEALRLARESGQQTELTIGLAGLAWLEARQGREESCRAHAAQALDLSARTGAHLLEIWALRALGDVEIGAGHHAAAIECLEECARRLSQLDVRDVDLAPDAELVDAYLRLGRVAEATSVTERLSAEADRKAQPWSQARASRCRGLIARDDHFDEPFVDAIALHEQTRDVFELAATRLAYGGRLRRSRQRRRAREQLRAALQVFDRLGASAWREMTRVELLATGETARQRGVSSLDTLTRQELHIAQVLAGGKTTREAAAGLFLSPKTVEYHLRNVYAKLGVSSRAELARELASRS